MEGWIGSITTLVGTLGGIWLGHVMTLQRDAKERAARLQEQAEERAARARERVEERVARLRDQYVSEFLATAYTNLRYLFPAIEGDPPRDPTAGSPADFSVLGNRAGLYVSDESEKAILGYTTHYLGALFKLNSGKGQQVSDTQPILNSLKDRLRNEVRGPSVVAGPSGPLQSG